MKNLKVLFTVLCVACATATWGAEVTLDFTSNNYSLVTSASTSENTFSVDGITFGYISCYFNTSGKYLMMAKSAGVLYCKSPIGTNITSIAVTYSSGTSTSGYLDVFFSNAEKNTRATSGYDVQLSVAKSSTKKADNNNSGRNYFNISVHNANNVQVTKIVVTYESSGSTETTDYFDVSFVDNVQGTDCSSFDMTHVAEKTQIVFNSISDKPQATTGTCEQTHYHFVGWIEDGETPNDTGSNVIAAGTTSIKATKNVTYKAVWAQEAN